MKIIIGIVLAALFSGRAQAQELTAQQACEQMKLEAKAASVEGLSCTAGDGVLTLAPDAYAKLRQTLFPKDNYAGFKVAAAVTAPGFTAGRAVVRSAHAAAIDHDAVASRPVNFDHAAAAGAAVELPVFKMGSATAKLRKVQSGPPGSSDGPPGSQDGPPGSGRQQPPRRGNDGPPGSGGDQDGPPGSGDPQAGPPPSQPPSRPAPVWRQRFAPPPPNWWNTDWNNYEWWQVLPQDYDQPYSRKVSEDRIYLYSGWSRWPDVFTNGWERETDSARINWKASDAPLANAQRTLTSQVHRDLKECYYQDVYRYDWVSGGFYGSHWEESFDHYAAHCIRLPTEYGRPRVATVYVAFDFKNAPALLPWETSVQDGVTIYYDGTKVTYDLSQKLLQYKVRLDDRQQNSESWTIVSGAKLNQPPEPDKVNAYLQNNGGVKLVIDDARDAFYDGETLEVSVEVKKDSGHWWKGDAVVLDRQQGGPIRVTIHKGQHPQATIDVPNQGSGKYYIKGWSFRRAKSKISTGDWVWKGGGNSIQY